MLTVERYNQRHDENREVQDIALTQLHEMVREGLGGPERSHVLSVDNSEGRWFTHGMYIIFAGALPVVIRPDEGLEGFGWTVQVLSNEHHYVAHNIETAEKAMADAARVYANAVAPVPSKYAVVR